MAQNGSLGLVEKKIILLSLGLGCSRTVHFTLLTTTLYVLEVITAREELTEELKDLKECANNTNIYLTDIRKSAKDTAEDTKKIQELIENLTENVSNAEKVNAQRYAQMKEYFTQLMKGNLANPEVPTHGELYSICFILNP